MERSINYWARHQLRTTGRWQVHPIYRWRQVRTPVRQRCIFASAPAAGTRTFSQTSMNVVKGRAALHIFLCHPGICGNIFKIMHLKSKQTIYEYVTCDTKYLMRAAQCYGCEAAYAEKCVFDSNKTAITRLGSGHCSSFSGLCKPSVQRVHEL